MDCSVRYHFFVRQVSSFDLLYVLEHRMVPNPPISSLMFSIPPPCFEVRSCASQQRFSPPHRFLRSFPKLHHIPGSIVNRLFLYLSPNTCRYLPSFFFAQIIICP